MPTGLPTGLPTSSPGVGSSLRTTFQVGTYNALTDTFSLVLDLNDFVVFWIEQNSMKMPQPKKTYVRSSNIRFPGEVIERYQYQNRHIQISVRLKNTSTQTILNTVRALMAAVENPPYVLRIRQPGATNYSYADVVAVSHNIPTDPLALLAQIIPSIQIDFECKPGLRGDRVALQNLVFNPGFETPGGLGVQVFNDAFPNANSYAVAVGAAPAVAANVMTIPAGTTLTFGSPSLGAIFLWRIRFQWLTGNSTYFCLHYTDVQNQLRVDINATSQFLNQNIAGVSNTFASSSVTMTNTNWYWLSVLQFPAQSGSPSPIQATLQADSAGAPGATLATLTGVSHDHVTALSGKQAIIVNGTQCPVGGAFTNVHTVNLFGPGFWTFNGANGGTGQAFGSIDGLLAQSPTSSNGNTYPSGPVTSYGCARIDCAPTGTVNAYWASYPGGTPAGSSAEPVNIGDTVWAAAWVKSSSLGASGTINLEVLEFSTAGVFLRSTTVRTLTGNQSSWVQLTGSLTIGANTNYIGVYIVVIDATTGSQGATVWIDNVQAWDQTTTSQSTMPYCELRFSQTPGQLLVSGIQGDMPAPCVVELGAYFATFATGQSGVIYLGRRATVTQSMRFVLTSTGTGTNTEDINSYGGYNCAANLGPMFYSAQAEAGTFHLLGRAETANGTPGNVFIEPQVFTILTAGTSPIYTGAWQGGAVSPFTAQNVWTPLDVGQIILPVAPITTLTDPTQISSFISTTSGGTGGSLLTVNFLALLPVDGELYVASLYNPTSGTAITSQWLYVYWDGNTPSGTAYSLEFGPAPNVAHGISNQGPRNNTFGSFLVTPTGDSLAQLDPTLNTSTATGVNQFLFHMTDSVCTEVPITADFVYSPLYLYPR